MFPVTCQPASGPGRGHPPRARALALLLVLAPHPLWGQPSDRQAREEEAADPHASAPTPSVPAARPTVVRARAPTRARRRVPTSTRYEARLQGTIEETPDLGEALRRLPPVDLHRTGGTLTTFSLRGSASHQVEVRVGEIPLTPLGGGPVDLSGLDPALFTRAEVFPGPAGAAFGAGALGGVLALDPWPAAAAPRTEATLALGSFGHARLALRQRLGPRGQLALAAVHEGGDFLFERDRTPNLTTDPWVLERRRNNDQRRLGLLAGDRGRWGAITWHGLALLGVRSYGVAGQIDFPTPEDRAHTARALLGGGLEAPLPAALRLEARAYLRADSLRIDRLDEERFGSRRLEGGVEARIARLTGPLRLEAGLAAEAGALSGEVSATRGVAALDAGLHALVLDERLDLALVVRADLPTDLPLQPSFLAGAVWHVATALALRLNLGRSTRLPTLEELYRESALVAPNPELRPESALAADLGLALDAPHRSLRPHLEAVVYATRTHDLIAYELYPPLKLRAMNLRDASIAGIETLARITPVSGLCVEASYAYTRARSLRADPSEAGRSLPYRPEHRGALRVTGTRGPLSAAAWLTARSELPRNRANTKSLPPQVLLGATLRARLPGGCSLALQVENLLDDRRQQDVHGYPLPGRTFLVSLRCAYAQPAPQPSTQPEERKPK